MKRNTGITLVALVVTIIILLILAGISIATLTGSGLFEKARLAEQESKNKQEEEQGILEDYENNIDEFLSNSRNDTQYKMCIDTSRQLACIGNSTDYTSDSYSYTATEDCAIIGRVATVNKGGVSITINSVWISNLFNNNSNAISQSINYFLKKGDTIEFITMNNTSYVTLYAYGLK